MAGILYFKKPNLSKNDLDDMQYRPDTVTDIVSQVVAITCFFFSILLLPLMSIIAILMIKTKFETKKFK